MHNASSIRGVFLPPLSLLHRQLRVTDPPSSPPGYLSDCVVKLVKTFLLTSPGFILWTVERRR